MRRSKPRYARSDNGYGFLLLAHVMVK